MTEKKAFKNSLIKLAIICGYASLYMAGGTDFGGFGLKWLRRFVAPAVLTGGMFYFSRDWRSLIQFPLMAITLSLGYNAENTFLKVLRRGIYGLANGFSTSAYNIWLKKWLLVGLQVAICVGISVVLGVWGIGSARAEELAFGLFFAAIPMFSVKEKNDI